MNLSWTPGPRLAATTTVSAYAHDAREYDGSLLHRGRARVRADVRVRDFAVRHRVVYTPSAIICSMPVSRCIASAARGGWRTSSSSISCAASVPSTGASWSITPRARSTPALRARRSAGGCSIGCRSDRPWAIEPGVRLDWNSFTGEASWQPRVRLSGRVGRSTTVWTGVAVQAQTPSHESLQGFDYFHLTPADGGRLKNERSRQIVAGIERSVRRRFRAARRGVPAPVRSPARAAARDRRRARAASRRLRDPARSARRQRGPRTSPDDRRGEHGPRIEQGSRCC